MCRYRVRQSLRGLSLIYNFRVQKDKLLKVKTYINC